MPPSDPALSVPLEAPPSGAQSMPIHSRPVRVPALVSVVVPCHNAERFLRHQLDALSRQNYSGEWEVILVANRCTDKSVEVARSHSLSSHNLRIVVADDGIGVSYARNAGIASARGEYVAMCDADDIVDAGWLAQLVLESGQADLVGGSLRKFSEGSSNKPSSSSRLPVPFNYLPFAFGCNLGVWREVVDSVGGWREDFRGGGDDVDFAWRAQQQGFLLRFCPAAIVNYRARSKRWEAFNQMRRFEVMNTQLYVLYEGRNLRPRGLRTFLVQTLIALLGAPLLLLKGRPSRVVAEIAGRSAGRLQGAFQHKRLFP